MLSGYAAHHRAPLRGTAGGQCKQRRGTESARSNTVFTSLCVSMHPSLTAISACTRFFSIARSSSRLFGDALTNIILEFVDISGDYYTNSSQVI